MDKKALIEAAKEVGRMALLAALPIVIDSLANNTFSWRVTSVAVLIAVLRAIDKYIHESPRTKANGLVPF